MRDFKNAVSSKPGRWFALVIGLCLLVIGLAGCVPTAQTNISLSEAIALSKAGNISKVVVDTNAGTMTMTAAVSGNLTVTDTSGNTVSVANGSLLEADIDSLTLAGLQELGFVLPADYSTTASGGGAGSILLTALPFILFIGLMFLLLRAGRAGQAQAFTSSKSRARLVSPDRPRITFADVAGVDEAKEDLQEVVEFLKNRWKFQAIGATIPKGVLLVGPPGTGKTLLARAVAGEAGVPFFSISGSEFVEMFVGVGAARVRDLFEQAKTQRPVHHLHRRDRRRGPAACRGRCPAATRSASRPSTRYWSRWTGSTRTSGVIVLAATNRSDVLDPALLRPGRFDRRVTLDLPDTAGRKAILQIHAKGKTLDD